MLSTMHLDELNGRLYVGEATIGGIGGSGGRLFVLAASHSTMNDNK